MQKLIIAGLIGFLLYTSDTFRTYTIEALKSVTTFINDLPRENDLPKENLEKEDQEEDEYKGFSTYED
tara:strand:+ start:149 stop:352 length:204 start_codon:yes stop_codon:yes gene_type:complete